MAAHRLRRSGARLLAMWVALVWATQSPADTGAPTPEALRVEVLATYPHDPTAFTQGLVLDGSKLYESTGLVGRSSLREVEVATGRVLRRVEVPPPYFAEGLALVGPRLFQLTWQNHLAFVYDVATFAQQERLPYPTEGWGLCFDGTNLIMSDGSQKLFIRTPATFDASGIIVVTDQGRSVSHLNELECVGPVVYANVWQTDDLVRIDRATGYVTARIRAAGLLTPDERRQADVLNGIAYDAQSDTFLITGKFWPKLFRVRFVPDAPVAR